MVEWDEAWIQEETPWDAGQSPPALVNWLKAQERPTEQRALVTGCGSGYDVFSLAHHGWQAIGLDLSPTSGKRFHEVRDQEGLTLEQADVVHADFFTYAPQERFHLIWDYTFLCAIPPERRSDWALQMSRLLSEDGVLVTLLFPVDLEQKDPPTSEDPGPPYRLHPDSIQSILEPYFDLHSLEQVDESHPAREGKEWLAMWKLKRTQ